MLTMGFSYVAFIRLKQFPSISSLFSVFHHFYHSAESFSQHNKENKGHTYQNGEIKLSLFANDMITYVEGLKESTTKIPRTSELISKVTGSKINTEKLIVFLHTETKGH